MFAMAKHFKKTKFLFVYLFFSILARLVFPVVDKITIKLKIKQDIAASHFVSIMLLT